jgi:hypothetical protein
MTEWSPTTRLVLEVHDLHSPTIEGKEGKFFLKGPLKHKHHHSPPLTSGDVPTSMGERSEVYLLRISIIEPKERPKLVKRVP